MLELCTTCGRPWRETVHEGPQGTPRSINHNDSEDHEWCAPRTPATLRIKSENAMMKATLLAISKGVGPFSRDPLTHCENTVEDMKALARGALGLEEDEDAVR